MTDIEWHCAHHAYIYAPHGEKRKRLRALQAITKALLQSPKQKKRRRRG